MRVMLTIQGITGLPCVLTCGLFCSHRIYQGICPGLQPLTGWSVLLWRWMIPFSWGHGLTEPMLGSFHRNLVFSISIFLPVGLQPAGTRLVQRVNIDNESNQVT